MKASLWDSSSFEIQFPSAAALAIATTRITVASFSQFQGQPLNGRGDRPSR